MNLLFKKNIYRMHRDVYVATLVCILFFLLMGNEGNDVSLLLWVVCAVVLFAAAMLFSVLWRTKTRKFQHHKLAVSLGASSVVALVLTISKLVFMAYGIPVFPMAAILLCCIVIFYAVKIGTVSLEIARHDLRSAETKEN